jgi:AcrR family transcriptional regulator
VSSIYLYFAGKDELVHTLMDEGFERWHRRMRDVADGAPTPPARLEGVCRAYVDFGLENPEFYEIMYMFHTDRMARYPKELFRRARRNIDLMAELVAGYAPDAVRTPDEARIAATAVWATLHGVVSTIVSDRLDRRIDRARYIEGASASRCTACAPGPRGLTAPGSRRGDARARRARRAARRRAPLRAFWVVAAMAAAVALGLGVAERPVPPRGRPPQRGWLSAAGMLLLAVAGIVGPGRRTAYRLLLAASLVVIVAGLALLIRRAAA